MTIRLFFSLTILLGALFLMTGQTFAQERPRVVGNDKTKNPEINKEIVSKPNQNKIVRPVLTNEIRVVPQQPAPQPSLVKKTGSSAPVNAAANNNNANNAGNLALALFTQRMTMGMRSRLGVPYRLGTTGPDKYDCSGLVWSVFQDAGISFTRTSARSYYNTFEPVFGDERYKFGTLVFFNGLGHVGIVIDEKTFYHASLSKGVTFSPFAGYWEKRIVGFRRIPLD